MTEERKDADVAFVESLRRTFIEEATELLESCEVSLMALDQIDGRNEALADIFRSYHSVKGSAAAIECTDLAGLAHIAEDCLAAFRKDTSLITQPALSLLLKVNDVLRKRLPTIESQPHCDPSWEDERAWAERELRELLARLEGRADGKSDGKELLLSLPEAPPLDAGAKPGTPVKAANLAIKIDAARIDAVMDMVGELVVIKSQITEGLGAISLDSRLRALVAQLDKSVRELHERTLSMRMVSLRALFMKMQRAVKDVSVKLEKSIDFEIKGEDTEIDRAMVERIADPLMHLCRNAVDHGIEMPAARQGTRKPASGQVSLKAYRKGESVLIEVSDDGRGIDKGRVVTKAIERGLLSANTGEVSDKDVYDLLFHPGFSTAEKVTDVSGRGVGLDVVKANVTAVGGTIEVESRLGTGSLFRLCIPLTTAITDGIVVAVGEKSYILPLDVVLGFYAANDTATINVDKGARLIKIKNEHYPFVRLGEYVGVEQAGGGIVVLIDTLGRRMALLVDKILGKTQVVLKPIGSTVGATEGLGGAAVMGNGKVALIIDVAGLAATFEREWAAGVQVRNNAKVMC